MTNTATTQALPSRLLNGLGEDAKPQPPPASDGRDRGQIASELCAQYLTICDYRVSQCIRLFRHEEVPVRLRGILSHHGSMRRQPLDVNNDASPHLPNAVRFAIGSDSLERASTNALASGLMTFFDADIGVFARLRAGSRLKQVRIVVTDGGDNASLRGLVHVLQKLTARRQYNIRFAFSLGQSGSYRAIRVVAAMASHDKVSRARAGYVAGGAFGPVQAEHAE